MLDSMYMINEVINYLVICLFIMMDKLEIIKIVEEIGMYDILICLYEDCCIVFILVSLVTKLKCEKVNCFEVKYDFILLIDEVVVNKEIMVL